jgi:hypothetical protein
VRRFTREQKRYADLVAAERSGNKDVLAGAAAFHELRVEEIPGLLRRLSLMPKDYRVRVELCVEQNNNCIERPDEPLKLETNDPKET